MKKITYFADCVNFGDALNPVMVQDFFGMEIVNSIPIKTDALCIGSLLETLLYTPQKGWYGGRLKRSYLKYYWRKPVKIWGTGFIQEAKSTPEFMIRRLDVHAVRGKLTLERLRNITGKPLTNVVLGDPGLLAAKLIDISKITPKYDLGIIPHYVDQQSELLQRIQVKNSLMIDICTTPVAFLQQVASCKHIISSAMHGLIAADSLGIPNIRMVLSDKITGGDYKFNDYYSAFGLNSHPCIHLAEREFTDDDLPTLRAMDTAKVQQICRDLIRVFPYPHRQFKVAKCLVVAPHPDDESLGCGGLMLKYPQNFDVLCVSSSGVAKDGTDGSEAADTRIAEFNSAMEYLGIQRHWIYRIFGDKSTMLAQINAHLADYCAALSNLKDYDYIFLPNPNDNHPEHRYLTRVLFKKILQKVGFNTHTKIVFYEVWSALPSPNHYEDVTNVLNKKSKLLECYSSQWSRCNLAEHIIGLNSYRGSGLLSLSVKAAEAFSILKIKQYLRNTQW